MEAIFYYLFKSTVWLICFAIIYFVFLRNERFFAINRYFLLVGIFIALIFPAITFKYVVIFHKSDLNPINITNKVINKSINERSSFLSMQKIAFIVYLLGLIALFIRTVWQIVSVLFIISKSSAYKTETHWLIQTDQVKSSFSFFTYVFINPSIGKIEKQEIIQHEVGHISQRHWFDLLLFEMLSAIQWFNPVVWFYGRMIRQNHEYLADQYALKMTENPAVYKATLLNQLMGGSVLTLTNSFNYSLNKKRFKMMNYNKQSAIRKFKVALILPLIAVIFYAFSEPNYEKHGTTNGINKNQTSDSKYDAHSFGDNSQIAVGIITWENNKIFSSKRLSKELGIKTGDKLNEEEFIDKLNNKIYSFYMDKGYIFFNIKTNKSINKEGTSDIVLDVFEGDIYKIGRITFSGETNKNEKDLKDLISIKEGSIFNRNKLIASVHKLAISLNNEDIVPDINPITNDKTVDIVFNF